jgi:phage tail-like protein
VPGMGRIVDLLWANGLLHAATVRGVFMIEELAGAGPSLSAAYFSPALHSPPGARSGWLRADLWATLPPGTNITIRSRSFESTGAVEGYKKALRIGPGEPMLREGWDDSTPSTHFGTGKEAPLRHYLGDETAEYLALRVDISSPACAPPVRLRSMDVLYPNRSLIEDLPAIYSTGQRSEQQFRRMLSPFQALADEIDDLIGDSIRRVDPEKTDDLWTGFLLSWLGHAGFTRLEAGTRRRLLTALPEILRLRGTLAGLARVMDVMAPEGYSIEDAALGPDVWILPGREDPAGARLGRDTRAAAHAPEPLVLGNCQPLGSVVLKHACFDPGSVAGRCAGDVLVRVFGGPELEETLAPFTDRIVREFVPAHTRVDFVFGAHLPAEVLERGRPYAPGEDSEALMTLDNGSSRSLGTWRLPAGGMAVTNDDTLTLNSAVLDGSLILE